MDENRCLLDVINNPQLLQSFLDSESSAVSNRNSDSTSSTSPNSIKPTTSTIIASGSASATSTNNSTNTTVVSNSGAPVISDTDFYPTLTLSHHPHAHTPVTIPHLSQDLAQNPSSTIETSLTPSIDDIPSSYTLPDTSVDTDSHAIINAASTTTDQVPVGTTTPSLPNTISTVLSPSTITTTDVTATTITQIVKQVSSAEAVAVTSKVDLGTNNVATNDVTADNATLAPTDTLSSVNTYLNETVNSIPISDPTPTTTTTIASETPSQDVQIATDQVNTNSTNMNNSSAVSSISSNNVINSSIVTVNQTPISASLTPSSTTDEIKSTATSTPSNSTSTPVSTPAPTPTPTPVLATPVTTSTPSARTTPATPATPSAPAPKRAPRRTAPKTSRAKNAKNTTQSPAPTTSAQSLPPPQPPMPMQTQAPMQTQQFVSGPPPPQYLIQSPNNGIRQPTILAQQQRVIQIQTANGPMLFAIAPGPTMNNNNVMNPQTIYVAGQQNSQQPQQQHIVLPPSQPMMMPRVPNQLILNRPMSSPGQLLPSQQQFIQIQTPNGPMLLALPTQPAPQTINNPMIDYSNQVQQQTPPQQHVQSKYVPNSKQSGLDLDDLLLDCGILPEERSSTTMSPGTKISQSPSLQQTSSPMPTMTTINPSLAPQMNQMSSPMQPPMNQINAPMQTHMGQMSPALQPPTMNSTNPMPNNQSPQQPMSNYAGQPIRQQPIRITIGPDGQMIMQPAMYGAIRPVIAGPMGQPHLNMINNVVPSNPQMVTMTMSPSAQQLQQPIQQQLHFQQQHQHQQQQQQQLQTKETKVENNGKKQPAKGKETTAKRSRSKKSDLDKFPTLKTPKLQEQQKQKQMQAVTVVPMTLLVGDQNKTVVAGSEVRSNVAQLTSGQQVSLAKIVTPVVQPGPLHPAVNNNLVQSGLATSNITHIEQSKNDNSNQNTQLAVPVSDMNVQNNTTIVSQVINATSNPLIPQTSSSGNVKTNLLHSANNHAGTVESNPHISSSLMPTLSLTVDAPKIEQNGLMATRDGKLQTSAIQGMPNNNSGPITATIVFNAQSQIATNNQNSQNQQLITSQAQQAARQIDLRVQSILNQLNADQSAALNPQTKQSFQSLEDACKRLLRYHVFNTKGVEDTQVKKCKLLQSNIMTTQFL